MKSAEATWSYDRESLWEWRDLRPTDQWKRYRIPTKNIIIKIYISKLTAQIQKNALETSRQRRRIHIRLKNCQWDSPDWPSLAEMSAGLKVSIQCSKFTFVERTCKNGLSCRESLRASMSWAILRVLPGVRVKIEESMPLLATLRRPKGRDTGSKSKRAHYVNITLRCLHMGIGGTHQESNPPFRIVNGFEQFRFDVRSGIDDCFVRLN